MATDPKKTGSVILPLGDRYFRLWPGDLDREAQVLERTPKNWETSLSHYLFVQSMVREVARGEAYAPGWETLGSKPKGIQAAYATRIWAAMREARIYDIDHNDFMEIQEDVAGEVLESLGFDADDDSNQDAMYDLDPEEHIEIIRRKAADEIRLDLPFEKIWLGLGPGVEMTAGEIGSKVHSHASKVRRAWKLGWLLERSGLVTEFFAIYTDDSVYGVMWNMAKKPVGVESDEWLLAGAEPDGFAWADNSLLFDSFYLDAVFRYIAEHRTYVEETLRESNIQRRKFKSLAKKWAVKRPVPPPYYLVNLQARLVKQEEPRESIPTGITHVLTHQFDRAAHYRVRFARGPLPLTPEQRKLIDAKARSVKGELKLFTDEPLDDETLDLLIDRDIEPKGDDEWMYVVCTRVCEHKVPADKNKGADMPYIPAIRKPQPY